MFRINLILVLVALILTSSVASAQLLNPPISVGSEISQIQESLNGEAERIDLIEVGLQRDLARLRTCVSGLRSDQRALRADLEARMAKLEERLAEITSLRQDVNDLTEAVNRGNLTAQQLQKLVTGLTCRVTNLEGRVADLELRVDDAVRRIERLEQRMDGVEVEHEAFDFHLMVGGGYLQVGELTGGTVNVGFAFDLHLGDAGNLGLQIDLLPAGGMVNQHGHSLMVSGGANLLAGWQNVRFLLGYRAGAVMAASDGSSAQFHQANLGVDIHIGAEASMWYLAPAFQAGWGRSVVADVDTGGRSLGATLNVRAEF